MSRLSGFIRVAVFLVFAGALVSASSAQVVPKGTGVANAEALTELILSIQKRYVRESSGERASQCFTDIDLNNFHSTDVPKTIANDLRRDNKFLAIVRSIQNLNSPQRTELLDKAASTYQPTWAQLGKIDRRGQTDAGQQAQKEIADTVVGLVKEMLK